MESRRPYSNFDFLGGRAATRKVRRLRRLLSLGLIFVIVLGVALRAGLSLYSTSQINGDITDLRTQDQLVQNQINAQLQSGATREQMLADLETRRELVRAALGSDAAAASFLARLAPLGSERVTLLGVSLAVNAPKEKTAAEAGSNTAREAVRVQVEARLASQDDVAEWIDELERYFPEVAWGFPKWDEADEDGSIDVTLGGPITAVDPARVQEILNSLQTPGGI
jgi:hypothetical protein